MLTPVNKGKARPVGASLWRKQILPIGEITYEGRKIRFDREYLAGLVKAFAAKAYDAVPFQFADAENKHSNRPEQRRGTVKALELTEDGLDVLVEADAAAQAHLAKYPDLGVSASIREGYERADGKFFPMALRHVLGTLDPRITGLRPWTPVDASNPDGPGALWQAVDFSADDGPVIDLTSYDYAAPETIPSDPDPAPAGPDTTQPEETSMALTSDQEARLSRLLDLPDDQFTALLTAPPAQDDEPEGTPAEPDAELTDEDLRKLVASLDDEPESAEPAQPEGDKEPALAGAQLSAEAQAAIDLANSRADEQALELARITAQLDRATYEKERDHFQRQYGVPARITDLARPVLEGSGRVVELANGSTADAGAIVRKLIGEFGKTMQALGLSVELGNAEGADDTAGAAEREADERRALASGYLAANAL
jgi:hypothetical protein